MTLRKMSINLEEKLIEKVDLYAAEIGVNRTAAITFLLTQGLQVAFYPDMLNNLMSLTNNVPVKK